MTTKVKIIVGFAVMVLLLAIVSGIGYSSLDKAVDGFLDYRRISMFNARTSDLESTMNDSIFNVFVFFDEMDKGRMDKALDLITRAEKLLDDCRRLSKVPEIRASIDTIGELVKRYRDMVNKVRESFLAGWDVYMKVVQPRYTDVTKVMLEMRDVAKAVKNVEILSILSDVFADLSLARSATSRFALTRSAADSELVAKYAKDTADAVKRIQPFLTTDKGKVQFADIMKYLTESEKGLQDMIAQYAIVRNNISDMTKGVAEMRGIVSKVSSAVDVLAKNRGDAVQADSKASQREMLGASGTGIVLAVLLACLIVFGVVHVLGELGRFAEAVAAGDFSYTIKSREKGAVGAMRESIMRIPATLNSIMSDYHMLVTEIEHGDITISVDAGKYTGAFSEMVKGTNNILTRFLGIIGNIPSPVAMLDKDLRIEYLNGAAIEIGGNDYRNKNAGVFFALGDAGTPDDALRRAVETKSARTSDTDTKARPQGKELDVVYTAIPMTDSDGNVISVLQLITDLTEIRRSERVMKNVAAQATDIANRVAAASEELSSQVEEISRGAEMQRTRVESTASAMTEMNSTVLEVAHNAADASEHGEMTRGKAQSGAELVNQVVSAINQVNSVAESLQRNMQELGNKAESIGGVMNVISDIADQTNLLALNAAIEAARAGEAGRGFAVVADEVRKLAEKTMAATHEVGESITAIQQSAKNNIAEVGAAVEAVTKANSLADSSGNSLREIVDLASATSTVVTSIATAAEEQSAASEEINSSLEEINKIVSETTQGIVQSAAAVADLARMAQDLNKVVEELRN
ncbi:MAG: methyl-accepting chemotaxis protein [Desulfovibrio sp.]|jgi:methyl-accepting chemotaxis protein|nr:methyl-accepting chemotaxis protein [Desulfovibrio sp.]